MTSSRSYVAVEDTDANVRGNRSIVVVMESIACIEEKFALSRTLFRGVGGPLLLAMLLVMLRYYNGLFFAERFFPNLAYNRKNKCDS